MQSESLKQNGAIQQEAIVDLRHRFWMRSTEKSVGTSVAMRITLSHIAKGVSDLSALNAQTQEISGECSRFKEERRDVVCEEIFLWLVPNSKALFLGYLHTFPSPQPNTLHCALVQKREKQVNNIIPSSLAPLTVDFTHPCISISSPLLYSAAFNPRHQTAHLTKKP